MVLLVETKSSVDALDRSDVSIGTKTTNYGQKAKTSDRISTR